MISSTLGGKLIQYGRLKILWYASVIGILGVALTLVLDKYVILVGRFLYGFSTGLIAIAMPRYLDEILPPRLIGLYGGLYCFSFAIATILAYMLAIGLPDDKLPDGRPNTEELKED